MACCCLSARCRPPDGDGCLEDRHSKLSVSNEVNAKNVSDIKNGANVCCFQISKFSNDAFIKEYECKLAPLKSVVSLSDRDKDIIKMQLSIWFPRILSKPFLSSMREVRSNISQTLSSLTFLKRNTALSKSKRQRMYHRKCYRKQQYASMILELSKSPPQTKELPMKETKDFAGEHCYPIEKPSRHDPTLTLSYGETNTSDDLSWNIDNKGHLFEAASYVEGGLDLEKIPYWFISFVESAPNLNLDLLTNDTYESQLTTASYRRIELIAISHQNDARKKGTYHVLIKEMVSDCLDAAVLAERRSGSQRADRHVPNASMTDGKKLNQPQKSVSDQSLNSNRERRKEKEKWLDGSFSEKKRVGSRRNWTQHTKSFGKTKREPMDKQTCTFHQINYHQPKGKAQTCLYLTENLPSGDFGANKRSNKNSGYNETQNLCKAMHMNHNHIEGQGKVIEAASIPNIKIATARKKNHLSHIDISRTRLNINNSSSNGINRTHLYSRDYFSGNPKTKVSYPKFSGKDEVRMSKEKPTSKSPRKKGNASLSGGVDSRQAIFASYRFKNSVKNASESSEDDSRSGNTMEELSNYKTIKRIAEKLNPELSLSDSSFGNNGNPFEIKRDIQDREDLRQLRNKPLKTHGKIVHKIHSAEVRERDGMMAGKYISESYSQNITPGLKRKISPNYRKPTISTTIGSMKDLVAPKYSEPRAETSANTPRASNRDVTKGADQDPKKSDFIKHKVISNDIVQSNTNHSDGKRNIDPQQFRQNHLLTEQSPTYKTSNFRINLASGKSNTSFKNTYHDKSVISNASHVVDNQSGAVDKNEVAKDTEKLLNINHSDGKRNIDPQQSRQNHLLTEQSPTYKTSNIPINLASGISNKSFQKTYHDKSVTSNASHVVDNQSDAVNKNEVVKVNEKNVNPSSEPSSNLIVDVVEDAHGGDQEISNEQDETSPTNNKSTFQGNTASGISKKSPKKTENDTPEPDIKKTNASHLVGNQGEAERNENVKVNEKNANRSSESSSDGIEDMVGDSYSRNHKIPNPKDENLRGLSPWEVSNKIPETAQGGSRINTVDSDLTRKLLKEGGDGPDVSKRTDNVLSTTLQPLIFTSGDITSNAGGEEEEETIIVSPKTSGPTIEKSEVPGNNVTDVEKRASGSEAGAKTENEEKEKGEQNKEDPCLDTLAECMRKWGRPNCGRNYSYMPNLDPPCCKSCYSYQTSVEAKTVEEEKGTSKDENTAMKCNYTGFTEDKQSELEALINKHVSYLRCTQGESAAMPKQTSFISSAPDPYSKLCKDLAFKSCAGLLNQSVNKDDICGLLPEICRDACPKLPPLCIPPACCPDSFPQTCYRDPCPKLPKLCYTSPPCLDPCYPAPCCTKLPSIGKTPSCFPDPCSTLPRSNPCCPDPYSKQSSTSKCCIDPCTNSIKPCRSPPYCIDPCPASPCIDPCTQQPCIPRSCSVDLCASPPPCRMDQCTGLPRPRSHRTTCIDPCTGYLKPCSPRPICKDPCIELPKSCSPPQSCIDPCTCLPKSRFSRSCCIDTCSSLPKACSPRSCIDPCTGLPKRLSPRLSCVDTCTGLPKSCMDPCSENPIPCKPCTSFSKQYRIDPITRLPILCSPFTRLNTCLDLCDKISSVSCNSASDTKLSMFNSSFSFFKEPRDSKPLYRPCTLPCRRQCSGSLSFLGGKPGSVFRRRSSSLDHFKGLHQRKIESQNLARKFQCMESKWSGIKQKACEVMDQIAKLQQEACCPKLQPCPSPCMNPCSSPICDPCPSPIINPCSSPICKPCPPNPVCACAPRASPVCNPLVSPRCCSLKPCYGRPQAVCCPCKRTPMCLDSFSLRNIYPSEMKSTCCPTSCIKTATVCCTCNKQTSMACRSACNQTSEFGRFPSSKCSTSCAQLNESSNKKFQVGSTNNFAEISTDIGPSLMGPTLPRKRGRTEKRCTIMRLGKCEEGGQTREPNTNTDLSCCSTQAEGGKIAEIAKFVKECFDDSTVSAITSRPVVKIRYNKGENNYCPNPCQDIHLKEQIAKAIKKGKEIQKKNCEKNGKNGDGRRSRTVLRFKAGKNSHGSCEVYSVQLEDDNCPNFKKDSFRKRKSEFADDSNPEQKGKSSQQNLDIHENKTSSQDNRFLSCEPDENESSGSQEDFNECHREISPRDNENGCLEKSKLYHRAFDVCNEQKLNKPSKAEKNQPPNSNAKLQLGDKSHCIDQPCVVLKRKRYFQSGKGTPSQENSDACVNECPQKRAASYVQTCAHSIFKQTHETDIKRQHNGCQSQNDDDQSNTNENANSDQFNEDDDKIISRQIPGVLSGKNDYSYDLSQYYYCMKSEEVESHNFVCDVFIESNESAMCKVNTADSKQSQPSLVRDAPRVPLNNNVYDFESPKSRYFRKQCFYLDDPSWEAFEYIGAHVFSLPTSYSSGRKNLHQSCDIALNKKEETKKVVKRHMFGRSRYTVCEKPEEGLCPLTRANQSLTEQGKLSTTLVVKDTIYDFNKMKTGFKVKSADEVTKSITYGTQSEGTKVKTPCDSSDTVLHKAVIGSHSQHISEECSKYQNGDQGSKNCSTKPSKWIPRETVCNSSPFSLPTKNPYITPKVLYDRKREKVKTSDGVEIKNCSGSVTEFCFSIIGSEDSCHGIEDLPLDTDSLSTQINKIRDQQKHTCCFTNKSTASSENKIIHAGDYVEVCSSVPFQNKTLTPKYTNVACDRQTQIQNHTAKKCVKPFEQVQKKSKNMKFRIVPLNEHVLSENSYDKVSCQVKNFQREELECGSRFTNSQDKRDRTNPIEGSVKWCFQDLTVSHDKENLTSDSANLNNAPNDSFEAERLSSECEHSRKYSISNGLLQKSDQKICPLTDLFETTQHRVTETPNKPSLTFNTSHHALYTHSIDKAALLGHIGLVEQGVRDLKANALLRHSNSFNRFAKGNLKETSDQPVKNKTVDAQVMTGPSVTSLYQRDMALQVVHENLNNPKLYVDEENMVDVCSSSSTVYVPQKCNPNQEAIGGGGDAWRTSHVGCAEVTQASHNRVILQGAYVQQQSKNMATSKPQGFRARNEMIIPFRLVFLKTSGTDKKKLNLKGTYSRPHLDSPASNVEIWGFQI